MAIGKQSLGRVAKSGTVTAPGEEVLATVTAEVKEQPAKAAVKTKTAATKPTKQVEKKDEKKAGVARITVIYKVGDKIPEYLL